jgi:hypothetical protein
MAGAVPAQDVHARPWAHARDALPLAALRPDGAEQAVAALVLGRPRPALPGGRAARGHPRGRPRALPRPLGRRRRAAGLPVARARGRRAVDHPAADRAARAARPLHRGRADARLHRAPRPVRVAPLVRRERRRGGPALPPRRPRRGRRRLPRGLHGARERLPGPGRRRRREPAAADPATQVAPRAPRAAAGAARGAAVRARAAALEPEGRARWPRARRLPVPRRRALAIPRAVYRLDTARRRTSHAVTLLRPGRAPRRDQPRLPRPYSSFTSRPRSFVVRAL